MEGTPFGRYRLLQLLDRGGMGEVWRAFDRDTNRVVALKVLPAHLATDPEFSERFRREANAAAGLNNPHVIPIHNFGEIDGRLYVDMRLVDGRNLRHVLEQGPLDPSRAVSIVEQIASALDAAHRIGLVHRDVKPSNVVVDGEDFAYLIDFGIVHTVTDNSLTATGKVVGTSAYMAPERISAGRLDPRSDVYALACMLHECLTGEPPFPADSFAQQIAAHLTRPPPKPSQLRAGVPKQFDAVIATGMAKDPDRRYATAKELARAARNALTAPTPRAVFAPEPPAARFPPVAPHAPPHAPPHDPTRAGAVLPSWAVANPRWWRRKAVIIPAAVLVVVIAVIASIVGITSSDGPPEAGYGAQVELPLTRLEALNGVTVDSTGTVYVADGSQVLKLAAGASAPTQLPVAVVEALGVAVDTSGALYVLDQNNVIKFRAGTGERTVRYPYVSNPAAVAVDTTGTVYVTDLATKKVFKFPAGAETAAELPFSDLTPCGVAADAAGTVYVADTAHNRVLKLPAGAAAPTELPFTGLNRLCAVAVDAFGAIYVVSNSRVLKLAAGATAPTELPFTGLLQPNGVAVDATGNVYVTDTASMRVLKLPVR